MAEKKTKNYKLIARQHSGPADENGIRKEYATGDMVPLTESQYEVFKDKFEPLKSEDGAAADTVKKV